MPSKVLAPAHIQSIAPYVPGKPIADLAQERGLDSRSILKLASNENPWGVSKGVDEILAQGIRSIMHYPDGSGRALKAALAAKHGIRAEQIVLGNGSNEILELLPRAYLGPGTSGVYAQHGFAVYPLAIQAVGAAGIEVPARRFGHDLAAMADAIRDDTRMVFIANPNNPTGTFLPGELVRDFLKLVPAHVLVLLDQAYHEYLPGELDYNAMAWCEEFPNLVVTRTFSKIHGLAGLRVGFGVMHPDVAAMVNRVRSPFNVNGLAQVAAQAALADNEFVSHCREGNLAGMRQLEEGFRALGLEWIPSVGNFVSFKVGKAEAVNERLLQQGVIVRPITSYGMPEWLRVTVGSAADNERFLAALCVALKG